MRWFRNTASIYYGGGSSNATAYNVVVGPYLYNDKVYGTADNLMYKARLKGGILDQYYEIEPVSGKVVTYHYQRIVGSVSDSDLSSWGTEIPDSLINGAYKFSKSIASGIWGGWSIPCHFIITKTDGTRFTGDYLRGITYADRFPSYTYCGCVFGNVRENKTISIGSSSSGSTSADLSTDLQYFEIDFGEAPQHIPAFIKNWILANSELITTPAPALPIVMNTSKGIRLFTADRYLDRDIEITPNLEIKSITENGEFPVSSGYAGIGTVLVNVAAPAVTSEEITITPTRERQEITPTNADYISKVIVEAIDDSSIAADEISFMVNDVLYKAEEGMTWIEWLKSSYASDVVAGINTSVDATSVNYGTVIIEGTTLSDTDLVYAWHVITPDYNYGNSGNSPTPA